MSATIKNLDNSENAGSYFLANLGKLFKHERYSKFDIRIKIDNIFEK